MSRTRLLTALLLALVAGLGGCGKGKSKPEVVAGCDASPTSRDIGVRFIVKELRALNAVTGEPRRSEFEALFDGDRIKPDTAPMIVWTNEHFNDSDLLIYGVNSNVWATKTDRQFANPEAEYQAYCTGSWSFDKYARDHGVPGSLPVPLWTTTSSPTASPSSSASSASSTPAGG